MNTIPNNFGFKLPISIAHEDQSKVIEFAKQMKRRGGFHTAKSDYVEPWYLVSLRSISNKTEVSSLFSNKVAIDDFVFRYLPEAKWEWVDTPITAMIKCYVDQLNFLYKNQQITRVQVVLQRPQLDLPLHRDRVMGENYQDTGYYDPLKLGLNLVKENFAQRDNKYMAIKIPLSEVPENNGKPIMEIGNQIYIYDVKNSIFAINEIEVRHGSRPVNHFRGVISIDGILDFSQISKLATDPINCIKEIARHT